MRFFTRPSRDDLYEKALAEKQRLIEALAEQVEYLRIQLGRPSWSSPLGAPAYPTTMPVPDEADEVTTMLSTAMFTREEEQDLQHLLESGQIDPADAASALAVIQAQNALISDYDPT